MATMLLPARFLGIFFAASIVSSSFATAEDTRPLTAIYPADSWERIDQSVDKALVWLSKRQAADGSFQAGHVMAQPAVTSFAIMAFLSRGHAPGHGPYGEALTRAIDYTLLCQHRDGYFAAEGIIPDFRTEQNAPLPANKVLTSLPNSVATSYNHAITSVMLAEVFGMVGDQQSYRIKTALDKSLIFTYRLQDKNKYPAEDQGGWRYLEIGHNGRDSDLSLTTWYLTFLRAAKNAGFEIPERRVEMAVAYARMCYSPTRRDFNYNVDREEPRTAMTGAGALCLALAGKHDDPRLPIVAEKLQRINFSRLLTSTGMTREFPMYASYYSSQAAAQIGGTCWENTYKNISRALISTQKPDGSWENFWRAKWAGDCYSTSLGVLSLTTPYQLLPIYQR
ncbi:prenyltransferase/squalene oxidase repeat-containing protein [Luteolibacter sp. AS25]|uniref:prenyltransferase/squalene oxidase repeat-containing protein n=1 Tax=Luteolibacter sp. AS25 TaxID=3135776 RepID=UPI00398ABC2A